VAKRPVSAREAAEIRTRLVEWLGEHYQGKPYRLIKAYGFHPTTARAWFREKNPVPPSVASLLALAHRDGLSVDWLLTGEGSPGAQPLPVQLRDALLAEFAHATRWPRRRLGAYLPDADTLWRLIRSGVGNAVGRADLLWQSYARLRRRGPSRRAAAQLVRQAWEQALGAWRTAVVPQGIVLLPTLPGPARVSGITPKGQKTKARRRRTRSPERGRNP
jgi:hypothetical protein